MSPPSLSRNAAYNLTGVVVSVAVALVTVPAYLSLLGTERYGVLAILWLLLGYFGLFDLGLSRALVQVLSREADETTERRAGIFWVSLILNFTFGTLGGWALYTAMPVMLDHVFHVSGPLEAELLAALPWIAVGVPIATVTGVFAGVLESRERFLAKNALQTLGVVTFQLMPLVAASVWRPALQVVVPAAVLARLLAGIVTVAAVLWDNPIRRPVLPDAFAVRALTRYGLWASVTNVVGPLLVSLDQILIGAVLGATMVAYYSVPFTLCLRAAAVPSAVTGALFPRLARYCADDSRRLAETAFRTMTSVMALVSIPGILLARPFLALWLGSTFAAAAAPVAEILMIGLFLNGLAMVPASLLRAQGRPDIVAKLHMLELAPFVAVLWLSVHAFGLVGAALAWTLRVGVDLTLLFAASRLPRRCLTGMRAACGLAVIALLAAERLRPGALTAFALALLAVAAVIGWAVPADPVLARFLRGRNSLGAAARAGVS